MHDIKPSPPPGRPRPGPRSRTSPPPGRPRPVGVDRPLRALPGGRGAPSTRPVGNEERRQTPWGRLQKFARTPKGYLIGALLGLLAIAAPHQGMDALRVTGVATLTAVVLDFILHLVLREKFLAPTSALLTGLIIGMVLAPQEPTWTVIMTAGIAIGAKHLLRTSKAHIFNPAAVALALAPSLFGSGESWWGATAGLPAVAILPLLVVGYLVAERANKIPQVLTFLGVYFAFLTAMTYLTTTETIRIASMYRDPFLNSVLFLAFFMLTDPPTSPAKLWDQIGFGAGVAILAVLIELNHDTVTYLLLALLVGNAYWAWRRVTAVKSPPRKMAGGARMPARPTTPVAHAAE
ncbi:MAG TPA: RnfABCDGE type electron transport complex subunit D [Chloroflexota bacterium]|nr:RnfABCDGE type electron transport complex subunit D [Chloroflexota bacterium]